MNAMHQANFNEGMARLNGGGPALLYKIWPLNNPATPPRLWYFYRINPGRRTPKGVVADLVVWTDDLSEATPLTQTEAWDLASELQDKNNGLTSRRYDGSASCTISVMPYTNQHPASSPGE